MEKGVITAKDIFRLGEDEACSFLRKNKCKIIQRNYRATHGEIDVVAQTGKVLVFVEVKARASAAFAQPWEAVGFNKRKAIKAAAREYVLEKAVRGMEFRFDIISIVLDEKGKPQIEWIQNAF